MPDEPTNGAGAGGSSSATFHQGAERADEATSDEPPRQPTPGPAHRATDPPTAGSVTTPTPVTPSPPGPASMGPTSTGSAAPGPARAAPSGPRRVRARKVRRIVRHIEPWSVLKISLLFYAALFLIICVASALLWNGARGAGTVDDVESFITDVGGFGRCEPIDGATPASTTTTLPGAAATEPVDQLDPTGTDTTLPGEEPGAAGAADDEEGCPTGEELVGEFRFEDGRIFQAFALGGIVLVLAGAAANVVIVLLFNLMSDLTGGVRITVLEEDPPPRAAQGSGSPGPRGRG